MIKPYHVARFHVAYQAQVAVVDSNDRMTGEMRTINEPIGAPRPRGRAMRTKNRDRHGQPVYVAQVYDPETDKPWKQAVGKAARSFLPVVPWDYPARVDVDFFFNPPQALAKVCARGYVPSCVRPDRDNLDKSTLDALVQARLLFDDSPVWCGTIAKWYTTGLIEPCQVLLPQPMATCDAFDAIDYRTAPGAIIRITLFNWADLGLKKPTRHAPPEAL